MKIFSEHKLLVILATIFGVVAIVIGFVAWMVYVLYPPKTTENLQKTISGAVPYSVTSSEGALTLNIPRDALPKGVSSEDIVVRRLDESEIPASISRFKTAAVYSLSPNGITFSKPINFSVVYNDPGKVLPFLFHYDGDKGSIPQGLEVSIDYTNKKATYTGTINSFSYLMLGTDVGWPVPLGMEFPRELGSHRVGESFPATAQILKFSSSIQVQTGSAPSFTIGSYKVSIGQDAEIYYSYVDDPKAEGRFEAIGAVEPKQYLDVPPLSTITGLVQNYTKSFTCVEEGAALITYSIRAAVHLREDIYTNSSRISDPVDTVLNWIAAAERDFVVKGQLHATAFCLPPRPKLSSFPIMNYCGGSVQFSGHIDNAASVESVQVTLLGGGGFVASDGGPLKEKTWYEITFAVKPGIYKYEVHVRTKNGADDIKETGKVVVDSCPTEEKAKDSFGETPKDPPPLVDPGYEIPPKDNLPKDPPVKDNPPATEPPPDSLPPSVSLPKDETPESQPEDPPPDENVETPPVDTDGDQSSLNTPDDSTDYSTPQIAIIHFSCVIKKEKDADGATHVNLIGGTEPLDSYGNYAWGRYLFGGGTANIGRTCFDPGDKAPICIDPRNGTAVDSFDFTTEFPNTPSGQQNFYDWFSEMSGGMRPCAVEEMPVKLETPPQTPEELPASDF